MPFTIEVKKKVKCMEHFGDTLDWSLTKKEAFPELREKELLI